MIIMDFFFTEMMGKVNRPLRIHLKDVFNVKILSVKLLIYEPAVNSSQ